MYILRDYQQEASNKGVEFFRYGKGNAIEVLPTGCHHKGYEILMYSGENKKVEDIKVGDRLATPKGGFRTVLSLHEGYGDLYHIKPSRSKPIKVNADHIFFFIDDLQKIEVIMSYREFCSTSNMRLRLAKVTSVELEDGICDLASINNPKFKKTKVKGVKYNTHTFTARIDDRKGHYYGFELDGDKLYIDWQGFVHHNSGKSLIIADIADKIGSALVFQPRKEILEQNYEKYISYGNKASIYSASAGIKEVGNVTFATIGSVKSNPELFDRFKYIIHDECHDQTNAKGGMYKDFYERSKARVLGLTATPYRLTVDGFGGTMLKFLTRTKPKLFNDVIYNIQVGELLERGFLNKVEYYPLGIIDTSKLIINSTGADYTDSSIKSFYKESGFNMNLLSVIKRLLAAKRKRILVFTRFIFEAEYLCGKLDNAAVVTGKTNKAEREQILSDFKSRKIEVVLNVGVLTVGFDYPELDTIVMARATRSLALYYQIVGRGIRIAKNKPNTWLVDLGDTYKMFGAVEDLMLVRIKGLPVIIGMPPVSYVENGRTIIKKEAKQLTNIYY